MRFLSGPLMLIILAACSDQSGITGNEVNAETGRWYSSAQVEMGQTIYQANCLGCHLENARGTSDWKTPLDDGSYPPPPLNGTAHAWHHALPVLLQTINEGGAPFGGKMPAFKDQLSDSEKLAVVAYFQSFWRRGVYEKWQEINRAK